MHENENNIKNQDLIKQICENHLDELDSKTTRRFIKTHLPFSLLPPDLLESGCKVKRKFLFVILSMSCLFQVIYVARNPKDVAVSYYHLSRLARNIDYVGNFETFWEYFMQDLSEFFITRIENK